MKKVQKKVTDVQGDVFFVREAVPEGAAIRKPGPRGHVLAEGEATGHAHVLHGADVTLYEKDGVLYVHSKAEATVQHEEHRPITVAAGEYRIGIVREYDPFAEEAERERQVRD